jgi:cytochrome b561
MTDENLRIFNKEALYSIVTIVLFWLFFFFFFFFIYYFFFFSFCDLVY